MLKPCHAAWVALVMVSGQMPAPAADIIAQWDFNASNTVPSIGGGVALLIGGVSQHFVSGSPDDPAVSNSAWNTAVYPPAGSSNKRAGVEFNVSTAGRKNTTITWDERISPTASKYGRLQYSTNGAVFFDFPVPIVMTSTDTFEPKVCNLTFPGVSDNPNFAFRIVTEFEATATGTGKEDYVTVTGTAYFTVGTVRFDMVTVWGDPLPASLSSPGMSTNGQVQFTVTGTQGSVYAVQVSDTIENPNWTFAETNMAPFIFTAADLSRPGRFYRAVLLP